MRPLPAETRSAGSDRPGRDDDHLGAFLMELGHLLDQSLDAGEVELLATRSKEVWCRA